MTIIESPQPANPSSDEPRSRLMEVPAAVARRSHRPHEIETFQGKPAAYFVPDPDCFVHQQRQRQPVLIVPTVLRGRTLPARTEEGTSLVMM